ncbi:MAG: GNAT family N-acetyltransferase [Ornithinibacter sp.]
MGSSPPGWATDLAILEHTGSRLEEHEDHLVVRTPDNPDFHWGNFVLVTDGDAVDDADRWVGVFGAAFPDAGWMSVGLPRMPAAPGRWSALGLGLELEDVLSTRALPRPTPLAPGYTVRRLEGEDWEQDLARSVAENDATGAEDRTSFLRFARGQLLARQDLSARGLGAWFGAFTPDGALVADLGIVRCGSTARYQDVTTDEAHRRQGLASHLLGVAAQWAADSGCEQWVIVTGATNPAGRVYRACGFVHDTGTVQAYRSPAR